MMDAANREWPLVALVTLNWNGKDHTIECVESLSRLTYPNYRVLIVDNGSTDGSVAAFHAQLPEALVIENGRNLGYSQGFNAGLQAAYDLGAEYVLILNNDTIVDRGVLEALVGTAERDEKIGFVSGKVYYYDRPNVIQTAGREPHPLYLVHGLVGEGRRTAASTTKRRTTITWTTSSCWSAGRRTRPPVVTILCSSCTTRRRIGAIARGRPASGWSTHLRLACGTSTARAPAETAAPPSSTTPRATRSCSCAAVLPPLCSGATWRMSWLPARARPAAT